MRRMFSENQIKEMIQSAISSGATKLYQHYIVVNETEFVIVSNNPISYEGLYFADMWSEFIDIKYASGDYEKVLTYDGDDSVYLISLDGSIADIDIGEAPVITSDEVLPL